MKQRVRVILYKGTYTIIGVDIKYFFERLFTRTRLVDADCRGEVVFEGKTKDECMNYLKSLPEPPKQIQVEASLDL